MHPATTKAAETCIQHGCAPELPILTPPVLDGAQGSRISLWGQRMPQPCTLQPFPAGDSCPLVEKATRVNCGASF